MSSEQKIIWTIIALAGLAIAGLWFYPRLEEQLRPELVQAWVAIEVEGSGVADIGRVEIAAGTPFLLRAVVEARGRDGSPIYYTEATRLRRQGVEVPAEALRPWDRGRRVQMLWFTVEGGSPYLEVGSAEELDRFNLHENYRNDWPITWTVPGRLDPARTINRDLLYAEGQDAIGTQRYHLRVEIFANEKALVPEQRLKSWGAEDVAAHVADFPTVVASLPGVLGPPSAVFGLTQLEPAANLDGTVSARIFELDRQQLSFSRLLLLRRMLDVAGRNAADLQWQSVDLATGMSWDQLRPGDLLQVLDRIVVLYQDRGTLGILDGQDLCFDFARGAAVRPLEQVFSGGEAEWSPIAPRS